jgi:hypothetical protein
VTTKLYMKNAVGKEKSSFRELTCTRFRVNLRVLKDMKSDLDRSFQRISSTIIDHDNQCSL